MSFSDSSARCPVFLSPTPTDEKRQSGHNPDSREVLAAEDHTGETGERSADLIRCNRTYGTGVPLTFHANDGLVGWEPQLGGSPSTPLPLNPGPASPALHTFIRYDRIPKSDDLFPPTFRDKPDNVQRSRGTGSTPTNGFYFLLVPINLASPTSFT